MNSREVVEAFFAYWGTQDVELTSALFHDDIVYKLHVSSDVLPFGGEWRGKAACRNVMFSILEQFDYLRYDPTIVGVNGDIVRAQVKFKYQHRQTGGVLEGTRRLVFHISGGLILRINGYHDVQLVDAFIQLTQHRLSTKQLALAPQFPRREKQGST